MKLFSAVLSSSQLQFVILLLICQGHFCRDVDAHMETSTKADSRSSLNFKVNKGTTHNGAPDNMSKKNL